MNRTGIQLLAFFAFLAGLGACTGPVAHEPGGPYYFERFTHPFPSYYPTLPDREISKEEAHSRSYWIEAYFNERGQVSRMVKYLDGRPSFDLRYYYSDSGSYEREEFLPVPDPDASN